MILIEGKKFACDTCIKGHRSSACKHTDRPLFEIQKKGRPITQCSHCRELRKTKQVHVKCQCGESKNGNEEPQAGMVKSNKKIPEAVYPTGVSTTLQASIVLIPDASSDSDQSGCLKPQPCSCKTGGQCHCAVPRKIKRTRQRNSTTISDPNTTNLSPAILRPHPDLVREYRHVLPKPTQTQSIHNDDGPVHVPSSTSIHGHVPRHHVHPDMFYSPYGRAYEISHSGDHTYGVNLEPIDLTGRENITEANDIIVTNPDGQSIPWNVFNAIQSLCGCSESCACLGCFEHRGSVAAVQALLEMSTGNSSCASPNTCASCVECSLKTGSFSETSPPDMQNVDEWLRQLITPSPLPSDEAQPLAYAVPQQMQTMTSSSLPQYGDLYISSGERVHSLFSDASECCGGSCKCPPGLCVCVSDCYGCCQGRRCEGHNRGERDPLTFAVSGERVPCCSAQMEDGSSVGTFFTLQPPVASSSSDGSVGDRRSRASSMSVSDGIAERWDGVHFVSTLSPAISCCSKERTASFYECADDNNIF